MDVNDMIRDEDLLAHKYNSHENGLGHKYYYASQSGNRVQQLVVNMAPSFAKRPSAREMNLLKRKAKINAKDQTKGWSEDGDFEVSHSQNPVIPKVKCMDPLSSNKVLLLYDEFDIYIYILVHEKVRLCMLLSSFYFFAGRPSYQLSTILWDQLVQVITGDDTADI